MGINGYLCVAKLGQGYRLRSANLRGTEENKHFYGKKRYY